MNWFESANEQLEKRKAQDAAWRDFYTMEAIRFALEESIRLNHNYVGAEHLLLGLIRLNKGEGIGVLKKSGLDFDAVRLEVEKTARPVPSPEASVSIPYTPRLRAILCAAKAEAETLGRSQIDPDHLLLGLLRENSGLPFQIFKKSDVDRENIRSEILKRITSA